MRRRAGVLLLFFVLLWGCCSGALEVQHRPTRVHSARALTVDVRGRQELLAEVGSCLLSPLELRVLLVPAKEGEHNATELELCAGGFAGVCGRPSVPLRCAQLG